MGLDTSVYLHIKGNWQTSENCIKLATAIKKDKWQMSDKTENVSLHFYQKQW